jgi:aspartate kinase
MEPAAQPIVVHKYGGSSVADVERVRAVARRVVATVKSGHRVVVVVSAMGNTTNELLALARSVSHRPGRRELDLLVSVGERVSMTLLAMAIEDLGIPAASFTGSQSGIITDEAHVAAQVVEVRPWRVRRALDQGQVAIVAGFQGVSRHGEVTTLGRGGSDTTAVVLAAALQAKHCEICSDVDGVWTADPRVVPGARKLDTLPLDAAAALARAGSKVLLADAVERARSLGVQLQAAATANPSGSGTRLPPGSAPDAVVAVSADNELQHIMVAGPSVLRGVPSVANAVRAWWTNDAGTHALIDRRNLPEAGAWESLTGVLDRGAVATVSAIGRAVVSRPGVTAEALASIGTPQHWGASGETFWAVVPLDRSDERQSALHRALLE